MPVLAWAILGGFTGGAMLFAGAQADDALEGGKNQVNTLLLLAVIGAVVYFMMKKGK